MTYLARLTDEELLKRSDALTAQLQLYGIKLQPGFYSHNYLRLAANTLLDMAAVAEEYINRKEEICPSPQS